MKREIKETKKNLSTTPKTKISEAKSAVKKALTNKIEKKAVVEIKSKTKKLTAKNPAAKPETKKITKISAKPVKQPVENESKFVKQSTPVMNRKNEKSVKNTDVKPNVKTKEKTELITAKEKISKPKTPKKSVAETKKTDAPKKAAGTKQTVKTKTQIKTAAESEKPLAKKNSAAASPIAKTNAQKKAFDNSKAEKPKIQKTKSIVSAEKSKVSSQAAKPKVQKKAAVNIKPDKPEAKKGKLQGKSEAPVKKVKAPEQKAVAEIKIVPKKPVIKKAKPISSAVLRGKKGRYDFEVFPLDANFEAVSAIYVISKRITDKRKRGHHKLVCIGQTESIVDEIKMHKKDKCIKRNEANVICLLKEESEKNRLRIEADLREAHTIACNNQSVI